jgi:DNA-binding CsgD family transcriptional regulator
MLQIEIAQSLAIGETSHALACALAFYETASTSGAPAQELLSRAALARVYNALHRYSDAQSILPPREVFASPYHIHPCHPHATLSACETLLGLGRFRESFDLATLLVRGGKGFFRAWALIFRAKASFHIGDGNNAVTDIKDAIAMFDACRGQSLYALCYAYRTAHVITQGKSYGDMVSVIEGILEDDVPNEPLVGAERGLTARQRIIARLAVAGETNSAIAKELNISLRTVTNSFNAIYARLGIKARWQLADALSQGER